MKRFHVIGLVVLAMAAATSATADDGRYLKIKEVFEEAEGLRIESVLALVPPHYDDGKYYYDGTCFKANGETFASIYMRIDLLARQSTDPGVGDFFVEEELSVVFFDGRRHEYDQERGIYAAIASSFKAVDRNGEHYLLEHLYSPDEATYCVYALE